MGVKALRKLCRRQICPEQSEEVLKRALRGVGQSPTNSNSSLGSVCFSSCCELDDQHQVVGLHLGLVGGAASTDLPALLAFGDDDIALLGIGLGRDGLQVTATGIGTVTGIDVHVPRPKAEGTMIAGGVAQGLYLPSAMDAGKTVVQLGKTFLFHGCSFRAEKESGELVLPE